MADNSQWADKLSKMIPNHSLQPTDAILNMARCSDDTADEYGFNECEWRARRDLAERVENGLSNFDFSKGAAGLKD